MKRYTSFFISHFSFLLFFLFCQTVCSQESNTFPLRLMTYNIRHGAGMDNVIDLDRQVAVIKAAMPDVVGLQEVDSCVKRSSYRPQAALLGSKTGMYATFGGAIPLTGGKYGVAILSKEQPLTVHNIPLPGNEKRTLLVCEFQEYVFATTHLDLDEECRLASLPIIMEEVESWGDKPFFICGDWNDKPSSTLISRIKRNFRILNNTSAGNANFTFPASNPTSTIDYIASHPRTGSGAVQSIKSRKVINEPEASDHRPVLVEVTLKSYTTGIHSIDNDVNGKGSNGEWFDLSGRKMPSGELPPGLYIQKNSGRKLLMK